MFSGTTINSVDAKGRVILPAKFREGLGDVFYITRGFNNCIQVLSTEQFSRLVAQIRELPASNAIALQHMVVGPAVEVSPNAQGRVQIPQYLREEAGLEKDAVIIGMDTRIEIWDKARHDKYIAEQMDKTMGVALDMLKL